MSAGKRGGWRQRLKELFGADSKQDIVPIIDRSWSGRDGSRNLAALQRPGPSKPNAVGPQLPASLAADERSQSVPPRLSAKQHDDGVATQAVAAATSLPAAPAAAAAAALGTQLPPPAVAAPRPEIHASSLPQPLARTAQQGAGAVGSGPGAPVSPDPAVGPPALRRVSSTPLVAGLQQAAAMLSTDSAGSMHKAYSGTTACEGPASGSPAQLSESAGDSASEVGGRQPGSSRDSTLHGRSCREGSHHARRSSLGGSYSGIKLPAAAAPDSTCKPAPKAARRARSPTRATSGRQPALGRQQQPAASAAAASRDDSTTPRRPPAGRQQQQQLQPRGFEETPSPLAPQPPPMMSLAAYARQKAAAEEAAAALETPRSSAGVMAGGSSSGQPAMSLLTFQLRGSQNSSVAPSREASVRHGGAGSTSASREASTRSRRAGGLSLALSRESSVRAGCPRTAEKGGYGAAAQAPPAPFDHSSQGSRGRQSRDVSSRGVAPLRLSDYSSRGGSTRAGAQLVGCGSGDWMGVPPATGQALTGTCAGAGFDPFFPSETPSPTGTSPPRELVPQEVGSWAQRMTTFPPKRTDSMQGAPGPAKHAPATQVGGLDPLALTAALEALAGSSTLENPAGTESGAAPAGNVLIGDSELAVTGSHLQQAPEQQALGTSWSVLRASASSGGAAGSSAEAGAAAAALSSSWDAATAIGANLPPPVQLGGSAPTKGASPLLTGRHGSAADLPKVHSQPLPCELAADTQEWNRSFMKRWRAVKKRAYLQALGLRALWRVNSLSDRHEPLELLTNDLPQYDNGMRRAWSVSRLAAQREREAACRPTSAAQPAAPRHSLGGPMHKDPSLAALLLGEVAEVC